MLQIWFKSIIDLMKTITYFLLDNFQTFLFVVRFFSCIRTSTWIFPWHEIVWQAYSRMCWRSIVNLYHCFCQFTSYAGTPALSFVLVSLSFYSFPSLSLGNHFLCYILHTQRLTYMNMCIFYLLYFIFFSSHLYYCQENWTN